MPSEPSQDRWGKRLWDALGTEFARRHELYEINYGGSTEEIRRYVLFGAQAMGNRHTGRSHDRPQRHDDKYDKRR